MKKDEFKKKASEFGFSNIEIDYMISRAEIIANEAKDMVKQLGVEIPNHAESLLEFGLENLCTEWGTNLYQIGITKIKIAQALASNQE
jgi:hypothetical protein